MVSKSTQPEKMVNRARTKNPRVYTQGIYLVATQLDTVYQLAGQQNGVVLAHLQGVVGVYSSFAPFCFKIF